MKVAAYQFGVTGDIRRNREEMENAIRQAAAQQAELIVFPECALTGYPPRDLPDSKAVDAEAVADALASFQKLADAHRIHIVVGTIANDGANDGLFYNRAYCFSPDAPVAWYDKRALYGWDRDNFTEGAEAGVFTICGYKIGLRICFEVRFPEYFRELYRAGTDLNIVLFNDVADTDDVDRYQMIRSHLITRAVENVTPFLTVDATAPYQTAPTCVIDASGRVVCERERNTAGLLFFDFEKKELNFGEIGRKELSDRLLEIDPN